MCRYLFEDGMKDLICSSIINSSFAVHSEVGSHFFLQILTSNSARYQKQVRSSKLNPSSTGADS